VEVSHRHFYRYGSNSGDSDKSIYSSDWVCGSASMARINSNRCVALERAVEAAVELVQPTRLDLRD